MRACLHLESIAKKASLERRLLTSHQLLRQYGVCDVRYLQVEMTLLRYASLAYPVVKRVFTWSHVLIAFMHCKPDW